MRDLIVATGCSFTDPKFKAVNVPDNMPEHLRGGWKMWPEIFKDKISEEDNIKYKLINTAVSGASMQYCFESLLEFYHKEKDKIKFMLWGGTEFLRVPHYSRIGNGNGNLKWFCDPFSFKPHIDPNIRKNNKVGQRAFAKKISEIKSFGPYLLEVVNDLKYSSTMQKIVRRQMDQILTILELCDKAGIIFLYNQILPPLLTPSAMTEYNGIPFKITYAKQTKLMAQASIKNFKRLCDSKNIHGWMSDAFGGTVIRNWQLYNHEYMIDRNKEYPNWDGHPTAEGQIRLGNEVWDTYNNIKKGLSLNRRKIVWKRFNKGL